jgi:hypothetical protein
MNKLLLFIITIFPCLILVSCNPPCENEIIEVKWVATGNWEGNCFAISNDPEEINFFVSDDYWSDIGIGTPSYNPVWGLYYDLEHDFSWQFCSQPDSINASHLIYVPKIFLNPQSGIISIEYSSSESNLFITDDILYAPIN